MPWARGRECAPLDGLRRSAGAGPSVRGRLTPTARSSPRRRGSSAPRVLRCSAVEAMYLRSRPRLSSSSRESCSASQRVDHPLDEVADSVVVAAQEADGCASKVARRGESLNSASDSRRACAESTARPRIAGDGRLGRVRGLPAPTSFACAQMPAGARLEVRVIDQPVLPVVHSCDHLGVLTKPKYPLVDPVREVGTQGMLRIVRCLPRGHR